MRSLLILLSAVLLALPLAACGGGEADPTTGEDTSVDDESAADGDDSDDDTDQAADPEPTEDEPAEDEPAEEGPTEEPEPTEEADDTDPRAEAAAELATMLDGESFPFEVRDLEENGPLFLHLAATTEDPVLLTASLQAMDDSWCPGDFDGCNEIDDEFLEVVNSHLTADVDPSVLLAALELGGKALNLDGGAPDVQASMVALADGSDDPAMDIAVLEQIWQADWEGDPAVEALYLDGVASADEALNKAATFRLETGSAFSLAAVDEFYAALTANLTSESFAIRGGSLEALGVIAASLPDDDPRRQEVYAAADSLRTDEHPYVRGAAMNAFSSMDAFAAIPTMIAEHMDDFADGGLGSVSYTQINGDGDSIGYDISPWSTPTDAALTALWSITAGTDYHFDYLGGYDWDVTGDTSVDEQIAAQAVPDAQAWFAANEAAIAAEAGA